MAMQNRILGRTGVSVSPLCLGAMMFGPWGNSDEADSVRVINRALDTDYIDPYQVHRPSQDTDVEETLGALTDLVRQGKVRYIGSSSYAASQIVEAQWTARDRHGEAALSPAARRRTS
jgi:aryl-alcohol dehydrogenase-like predicted oxidoreductase